MYIFDTSSLKEIFHFYPKRFPSLWKSFGLLVSEDNILSVKEVYKEIIEKNDHVTNWSKLNKKIFLEPDEKEVRFVMKIFEYQHFQSSLEKKKLLKGGNFADPFIIASAKIKDSR